MKDLAGLGQRIRAARPGAAEGMRSVFGRDAMTGRAAMTAKGMKEEAEDLRHQRGECAGILNTVDKPLERGTLSWPAGAADVSRTESEPSAAAQVDTAGGGRTTHAGLPRA